MINPLKMRKKNIKTQITIIFLIILLNPAKPSTDTVKESLITSTAAQNLYEIKRKLPQNKKESIDALMAVLQPTIYYLKTYLDMKLVTLGLNLNDSMPMIVTRECNRCALTRLSSSLTNRFDELRRLRCPDELDLGTYCPSYVQEGLTGLLLKTKIQIGTKIFELKYTLLVDDVYPGHPLTKHKLDGVIGFRQPDYDGNYDMSFLRQTYIENEMINPNWEIRIDGNNSEMQIGAENLARTYFTQSMDNSYEIRVNFEAISWQFKKDFLLGCTSNLKDRINRDECGKLNEAQGAQFDLKSEVFLIGFMREKTLLRNDLFHRFVGFLRGKKALKPKSGNGNSNALGTDMFSFVCRFLGKNPPQDHDQFCEGVKLNESLNVTLSKLKDLKKVIPNIQFKANNNFNFSANQLFMIKRPSNLSKMTSAEVLDATYELEFMFEIGSRNILGMTFLEGKVVNYNSYSAKLGIGDASLPNDYQDNDFSMYVALKVTLDIFIFILMITLIFAVIISYDKFVNKNFEEE